MAEQKNKSRLVVAVVVVIVAAVGIVIALQQRAVIQEHNRIVDELVDQGAYREAVTELEPLHERAWWPVASQVEASLITCYIAAANDPTSSLAQAADYLERVRELDPDQLTDEHRQILRTQGR